MPESSAPTIPVHGRAPNGERGFYRVTGGRVAHRMLGVLVNVHQNFDAAGHLGTFASCYKRDMIVFVLEPAAVVPDHPARQTS